MCGQRRHRLCGCRISCLLDQQVNAILIQGRDGNWRSWNACQDQGKCRKTEQDPFCLGGYITGCIVHV